MLAERMVAIATRAGAVVEITSMRPLSVRGIESTPVREVQR